VRFVTPRFRNGLEPYLQSNKCLSRLNPSKGRLMAKYYIICPYCGVRIELADTEPEDLFNVVGCPNCDRTFDYDPKEVQQSNDEDNDQ
jgi:hypothetical protein